MMELNGADGSHISANGDVTVAAPAGDVTLTAGGLAGLAAPDVVLQATDIAGAAILQTTGRSGTAIVRATGANGVAYFGCTGSGEFHGVAAMPVDYIGPTRGVAVLNNGVVMMSNLYVRTFYFNTSAVAPTDDTYFLPDNPGITSGVFTAYLADEDPAGYQAQYLMARITSSGLSTWSPGVQVIGEDALTFHVAWDSSGNFGLYNNSGRPAADRIYRMTIVGSCATPMPPP